MALFSLKSLVSLDVSNNKLQYLPFEMWFSSSLKELNLSFNLLCELPCSRHAHDNEQASSQKDSLSDISYDSDISETAIEMSEDTDLDAKSNIEKSRSKHLNRVELNHNNLWSTQVDIQGKIAMATPITAPKKTRNKTIVDYQPGNGDLNHHYFG